MMRRAKVAAVFFVVLASLAQADTITVGPGGGYDFNNIQAAINDSNDGDTVIVAEAIHKENISFNGKNIVLTSTNPNDAAVVEATIIDGNDANSVVTFSGTENASCEIVGFTITNGRKGMAVYIDLQAESGDVESGWAEWSEPEDTRPATIALSADFDDDFSATLDCGKWLDNGDWQTHYPQTQFPDMLEDGYRRNQYGDIITLTFSNLEAGDYVIVTCHVDMNHGGDSPKSTFAVRVDGNIVKYGETFGNSNPEEGFIYFGFTSNGSDDVVIEFDGTAADPPELNEVWLNGFMLMGPLISGGGIAGNGCLAKISKCVITGNWATYGGGIYDCDGQIADNIIRNNEVDKIVPPDIYGASGDGGGLYDCDGLITGNIISDNAGGGGGGGGLYECDGTIRNNIISHNHSLWGGGLYNCNGTITNNLLVDNRAVYGGAFVSCDGSISNCTLVGNWGSYGSGLYECNGSIGNCIIWQNGAGIKEQVENCSIPVYSCIEDWSSGGIGNISSDPCFAQMGYWQDMGIYWVWVDNGSDYHLKSQAGRWDPNQNDWVCDANTSPCIDAGDMSSPIGYEPFPNGGVINMGVYGGTDEASKSYFGEPVCQTPVAGDINGDCRVNFVDFSFMVFHWLEDYNP